MILHSIFCKIHPFSKKAGGGITSNRLWSVITICLTLTLCTGILFSMPLTVQAEWYTDSETVHSDTSYEDMSYTGYDANHLLDTLETMETLCQKSNQQDAILSCYQTIVEELDQVVTQRSLNSLRYYNDVNHEEYQQVDTEMSLLVTDLADRIGHTLHIVLESPYYDVIANALNNEDLLEYYLNYEDMTEEEKQLAEQENRLVQKYDQTSSTTFTYTDSAGKTWTADMLDTDPELAEDYEKYIEVNDGLAKARNDLLAPIYLDLVANRNRQAVLDGFANYAEYAYSEIYGRDYSTEEIQNVYKTVKENFVPIMPEIYNTTIELIDYDLMDMPELTDDKVVEDVAKYLPKIDPELTEAFEYMTSHHLYDMDASDTKMDMGYTDYLYTYQAPVIFYNPNRNYYDYSVLIHEYGHYNNAYHNNKHALTDAVNMDVAEIHSQGMEILFLEYSDKLFHKKGDSARMMVLYNMVSSVIEGCLYDEFQNQVYAADHALSVPELNQIFSQLASEYGYADAYATTLGYSWVDVSHTFQSPMYYISYATSALSALDLLSIAQDDRQKAIDCYMELTTYGLDTPYRELLVETPLRDIFEKGTVSSIAQDTLRYSNKVKEHAELAQTYRFLRNVSLVIVTLIAVIAIIVILVEKKLAKRDPDTADTIE